MSAGMLEGDTREGFGDANMDATMIPRSQVGFLNTTGTCFS